MPDQWTALGSLNADLITEVYRPIETVSPEFTTFFESISTALGILNTFVIEDVSALVVTVNSIVDTIEEAITDVLQNNVALAFHLNLQWDPAWSYSDFTASGAVPWIGGGTAGWLLDLGASANDKSDPYRPLTDTDTKVGGVIILTGVSEGGNIEGLQPFVSAFSQFADFGEFLEVQTQLDLADDGWKALSRLGPAVFSDELKKFANIPIPQIDGSLYRRGQSPQWMSLPISSVIPLVNEALSITRDAADALRFSVGVADGLSIVADRLIERAKLLDEAVSRLDGVLQTLGSVLAVLGGSSIIYLEPQTGGMANFVTRAQNAADVPNFGDRGIVIGLTAITTSDDPSNHFERFLELIGLRVDTITANSTVRAQNLSDTFDGYFP
jgi:hypothetical protein